MASVSKQMSEMLAEIRSVRQVLDDEIKRSREDHDQQIGMKKDVDAFHSKLEEIESRIEKKLAEFDECLKDTKKRKWDVILTLISAFVTAIASLVVYRAFSAPQAPDPRPADPKPHSAIYQRAEPRPSLFLRGTGRESQNPTC